MVLGLLFDLTIVNSQRHSSRSWLRHKKTKTIVNKVVLVFIFLEKDTINTFLEPTFNLVDVVLRSWLRATSHYQALKLIL